MKIFENVPSLKDATLRAGQLVETKGYYEAGDGGGGRFLISSSDLSAEVAADTHSGIYVPINGDVTGASGAGVRQYDGAVSVKWFGAISGDLLDHSAQIQAALNFAGSIDKTVEIVDCDFKSTTTLAVPDGMVIVGVNSRIYNDENNSVMLDFGSGCSVEGLTLEGYSSAVYSEDGIGITITGTVGSYKTGLRVSNCTFSSFSFSAVSAQFASDIKIADCTITNCAYAGIAGSSVEDVHLERCTIDTITPGTGGNAYGVYFTRQNNVDLTVSPKSKRCSVTHSTIKNVAIWEGLDTHGGDDITFNDNVIEGCRVGIAFINSIGLSGSEEYASKNLRADRNKITGISGGEGLIVEGVSGNVAGPLFIRGNKFEYCGSDGNASSGAIEITSYCRNVVVSDNVIKKSSANGIAVTGLHNDNLTITNNIIEDVSDSSYVACSGINLAGYQSNGIVSNNTLISSGTVVNTYVNERGIYGRNDGVNSYLINNNINEDFTTPYQLIDYGNSHIGEFNGIRSYSGLVAPEGVVTGTIGARFINRNGGAGATLYIKETGINTNTGWVAK